jgi:uracil-DNA glycosylase family 4
MQIKPTGPCPARIMIVGEAPGEQEVHRGEPFVGSSGMELNNMLKEAGIMRSECFVTNVIRVRPPANNLDNFIARTKSAITGQHLLIRDKFVLPVVRDGLELLKREIEMCRPNVIIAVGNVSLWALTGENGITSWRGSVMQCDLPLNLDYQPKVVPTYHPAAILRQWSWRQIAILDLRRAKAQSMFQNVIRPDYKFVIRPDYSLVLLILQQLYHQAKERPGKLSVDIETRAGHIACIGLAWSTTEAICIPLMCTERKEGYWSLQQETAIVQALRDLLTHENCHVVGQNFLYDAQYINRHWLFIPNVKRDTMLSQHVMFSNLPKGLDFLSSFYCEHHLYWKEEGKNWDDSIPEDRYWEYNCKDAVITFEVDDCQQDSIDKMGLREVHDFQQSLFAPVLQTMNLGIRVDTKKRMEFAMTLQDEIAAREQWFIDVLGHPLNPRSGPQMKGLFYEQLKLKPVLNRKTGNVSCDDEALQTLANREPLVRPLVNKISEYRSLGVFFSTFVQAPLDVDGRVRCSFNIGGTDTYRFSSSKNAFGSGLNLQNIPKGGENSSGLELPNVRNLFVPDPGRTFFDIDLSSADLRIVVWEADEPEMKALLKAGLDPYTEIAKEFYRDQTITKKDPRRQTFKSFAHGTNYLGTAEGLAGRLGMLVKDAERTQKWYFERFPRIKAWQEDLKDQVYKRRMVKNVFGYRMYFFDRIEGTIFNQAAAWIPQSTVACLINRAYVKIHNTLPEVEVLLQVHDSLAGQYPTHLGEWMEKQIVSAAEIELPYPGDPLIIPIGIKTSTKSWGDCE